MEKLMSWTWVPPTAGSWSNIFRSCLNWLFFVPWSGLTHWGRVTHQCVSKLIINVSDNGLSPGRRQAIIWTNAGLLLIGLLGTNSSEILIEIYTYSFMKMHLKMSYGKWWTFCLGFNVITHKQLRTHRCVLSNGAVATDALVLKYQAISSSSAI